MLREGYEVYEGYVDGHEEEMREGKPFIVEVRDLSTFTRMIVRALVSREKDAFPDGSPLWFKDLNDEIVPEPGSIKILEELDDEVYAAEKSPRALEVKGRGRGGGKTKTEVK